jgi:hypothetical protein
MSQGQEWVTAIAGCKTLKPPKSFERLFSVPVSFSSAFVRIRRVPRISEISRKSYKYKDFNDLQGIALRFDSRRLQTLAYHQLKRTLGGLPPTSRAEACKSPGFFACRGTSCR